MIGVNLWGWPSDFGRFLLQADTELQNVSQEDIDELYRKCLPSAL